MIADTIETIDFYSDGKYKELLEKSKKSLTYENTQYIWRLIDAIQSEINWEIRGTVVEKILFAFLSRSNDYGKIYFVKEFLYDEIFNDSDGFWEEIFDKSLKELCGKKVLIETIYNDIKSYSLNDEYIYQLENRLFVCMG